MMKIFTVITSGRGGLDSSLLAFVHQHFKQFCRIDGWRRGVVVSGVRQ